jgi:hypothetical protein
MTAVVATLGLLAYPPTDLGIDGFSVGVVRYLADREVR